MRTFIKKLLVGGLFVMFVSPIFACSDNEFIGGIDADTGDDICVPVKFSINTTAMAKNDSFGFSIHAQGTFYVDWGEDDSTPDVLNATISGKYASHKYNSAADSYTVKIGWIDAPTRYYQYDYDDGGVFGFGGYKTKVKTVDGSLGALFPTLTVNNKPYQPQFMSAFSGCTNLESIPSGLFDGVSFTGSSSDYSSNNGANVMFKNTFKDCVKLKYIPSGLFADIHPTSNYSKMFEGTFSGCTGLGTDDSNGAPDPIPSNLFNSFSGTVVNLRNTFKGCTGLKEIPAGLFSQFTGVYLEGVFEGCTGLTSIPSNLFSNVKYGNFTRTFADCTGITSIPSGLFGALTGVNGGSYADAVFTETFSGCTSLTSIPINLFSFQMYNGGGVGWSGAFKGTFKGCTSLTSLPNDLFSNINVNGLNYTQGTFESTFEGCTSLTSIPNSLFAKIIPHYGYQNSNPPTDMFKNTFKDCTGLTSLPKNLFTLPYNAPVAATQTDMFAGMFSGCTGLGTNQDQSKNYIPATLFMDFGTINADALTDIFLGTNLLTTCPDNTIEKIYANFDKTYWNNKVACVPIDGFTCPMLYTGFNTLISCTANSSAKVANAWSCLDGYVAKNGVVPNAQECVPIATYQINYDLGDANASISGNPQTYTNDTNSIITSVPVRNGHAFTGWCVYNSSTNYGANCSESERQLTVNMPAGYTSDWYLYATWETEYTIAYHNVPNGVTNNNPQQYTASALPITLSRLSRDGYTFKGWCSSVVSGDTTLCPDGNLVSEIDAGTTGNLDLYATWKEGSGFSLTATDVKAGEQFCIILTPNGEYNIDWGDNNTTVVDRSGIDVTGEVDDDIVFCHEYTSAANTRTITLAGETYGYFQSTLEEPIYSVVFQGFGGENTVNITSVSGSLGAVFPTLNNGIGANDNPSFFLTFAYTSLAEIPSGLFDGVTKTAPLLFAQTFYNAAGTLHITKIPENLFADIDGVPREYMFYGTFLGNGVTSLPASLFPNISGVPQENSFWGMFYACEDLSGYVPATLFENLDTNGYAETAMEYIFVGTQLSTDGSQCPNNMTEYDGYDGNFRQYWYINENEPANLAISCNANASSTFTCANPKIELSMLGAPMCLIPGLPQNNELGLIVRNNGNQYHMLLSTTEQVIHTGSEHKVKIITQNGTYYVHDESVAE